MTFRISVGSAFAVVLMGLGVVYGSSLVIRSLRAIQSAEEVSGLFETYCSQCDQSVTDTRREERTWWDQRNHRERRTYVVLCNRCGGEVNVYPVSHAARLVIGIILALVGLVVGATLVRRMRA